MKKNIKILTLFIEEITKDTEEYGGILTPLARKAKCILKEYDLSGDE